MGYIENPKTKGSGIVCAIPQSGTCPNNCADCFFQSGRSYLEPLEENLPNMPYTESLGRVVRVNDGNDSNNFPYLVRDSVRFYAHKFYNTSTPKRFKFFRDPVVLTINPAEMTDKEWHKVNIIPKNLMFVRIRTNMWNLETVVRPAIKYYTEKRVPIVLTFMAYYDTQVPEKWQEYYIFEKRTLNAYWVLKTKFWKMIMDEFWENDMVYSCSKIEGEKASRSCARCGNCIREYFVTMERVRSET